MRPLLLLAYVLLAACTDPRLSTTLSIGQDGLSVNPTLSGRVGDATVTIDP